MVAFSKIALAAATAGSAMASPLSINVGPLAVFDSLKAIPSSWVSKGAAPQEHTLKMQIGLKQSNIEKLQAKLLDISHPKSPNYGKWLSKKEVDEMTAPSKENIDAVKAWLAAAGITNVQQPTSDWIEFNAPVSKLESLLNAKYESFYHATEQRSIPRTKEYSVPHSLHDIIDVVTPTTAFYEKIAPQVTVADQKALQKSLRSRAACDYSHLTPDCLKSTYNVDYTGTGNQLVATTELINQGASHDDFAQFTGDYASGAPDFKDVSVSGGANPGSDGDLGEGNLDTQWAAAIANPNPSEFIALGPEDGFADEIANLASYLTSSDSPPNAVSTSYGGGETQFSNSYLNRVCNDFMKAGSMGVSVFFSSGDSGIGGNKETDCSDGFYTNWPASCPWATSVGATQFNGTTETVAEFPFTKNGRVTYQGSSGGGFSEVFPIPDYQSDAVAGYKSQLDSSYSGLYNDQGRGYPDVSLVGKGYIIAINGKYATEGGTSASSPAWAGLTTLLNDYRKSQGKSNLGFLNPLLYQNTQVMRDITHGDNTGCGRDGFPALQGWDAATGLGSVDFGKLRAIV